MVGREALNLGVVLGFLGKKRGWRKFFFGSFFWEGLISKLGA